MFPNPSILGVQFDEVEIQVQLVLNEWTQLVPADSQRWYIFIGMPQPTPINITTNPDDNATLNAGWEITNSHREKFVDAGPIVGKAWWAQGKGAVPFVTILTAAVRRRGPIQTPEDLANVLRGHQAGPQA